MPEIVHRLHLGEICRLILQANCIVLYCKWLLHTSARIAKGTYERKLPIHEKSVSKFYLVVEQ